MSSRDIACTAVLKRKSASLPRYVVIPTIHVSSWDLGTRALVEGTMNGMKLGRLTLQLSADDGWVLEIPSILCAKSQVDTGDVVSLELRLTSEGVPHELQSLIDSDPLASEKWTDLSDPERRVLRDHVSSAMLPDTRARRARSGLGLPAE